MVLKQLVSEEFMRTTFCLGMNTDLPTDGEITKYFYSSVSIMEMALTIFQAKISTTTMVVDNKYHFK